MLFLVIKNTFYDIYWWVGKHCLPVVGMTLLKMSVLITDEANRSIFEPFSEKIFFTCIVKKKKKKTKVQTCLCRCTGQSAHLLFALWKVLLLSLPYTKFQGCSQSH